MARGARLAGDSSPLQLGIWIAIAEWLAKFPMFWWLAIIYVVVKNIFKHYWITLGVVGTTIMWWYGFGSFANIAIVTAVVGTLVAVTIVWLYGGNYKTPYYYFKLKRNWRKAMIGTGLKDREKSKRVPEAYHIRPASGGLECRVNMRKCGRGIPDLAAEENEVAEVLGAHRGSAGKYKPGIARYIISWDKEVNFISERESKKAAAETVADGDRSKIVIGKLQGGGPAIVSLLVSILVVGVSGAGKTTLFKAICQGLRRQKIEHEFYVIDPKGGIALQELENASNTKGYTKAGDGAKTIINKAYAEMQRRFDVCREMGVDELPGIGTEEFPAQVILIDELLRLPEELLTADVSNPLAEIAANGRAVGVVIIAGSQLGQVDAIGRLRDLFGQRICLRTSSPDMTDAVLGRRAEMNGARCSLIPANTPGVGYIFSETENGLRRFRSIKPEGSFIDGPVVIKGLTKDSNRQCAVYKYYNFVGRAWYFGNAFDPEVRAKRHAATKLWWPHVDHSRTQILWYKNKAEAEKAEAAFIDDENPVHNTRGRKLEEGGDSNGA